MENRFEENCNQVFCSDIIDKLEEKSPREYACEWDNVGLLLGRRNKEVKRIMVALDATMEVVKNACASGCDMLVTHHPLIFSSLKNITDDSITGKKLLLLAEQGISYYAMHTNFDTVGSMASAVAEVFLGLDSIEPIEKCDIPGEGMGRIVQLPKPMTKDEVCVYIEQHLDLPQVIFYPANPDGEEIPNDNVFRKAAIMPGSGKSFIDNVVALDCDLYITGDMGYHEVQHATELGLSVIDATHDGLEKVFARFMADYLKSCFSFVEIDDAKGLKAEKIPYSVILEKVCKE